MTIAARIQTQQSESDFERLDTLARHASEACDRGSTMDVRQAVDEMKIILDRIEAFRDAKARRA